MATHKNKNPLLGLESPWTDNANPIWLASTVRLLRNIEKFNFPPKLNTEKRKQVLSLASQEVLKSNELSDPFLLKAEEMTPIEKEFLYEHFLTPQSFHQAYSGEGFIVDKTGQFLSSINSGDHLHFHLTDCTGELEMTWNRLTKVEISVGKSLNYAFSQKFGFLTSHYMECGTGLVVSLFFQLPALIHTLGMDDLLIKHKDDGILLTGLQGKPREIIGDLVVVQNNDTLGLSEENIISSIRNYGTKLLVHEKSARAHLRDDAHNATIKDKVSRAFGVLIHSYRLDTIEAMNAISLLKLGLDLGWLKGVEMVDLNRLFFKCRRGHILSHFDEEVSQEELPHKRAEFIHAALKQAQLLI